ncbi:uncharacterized protein JCM6883_005307 [Sporobolomyces salmoneus]|uniref:uncharacterized protein n=1 Tax=Sporobolomyces salmoneus TaxID=183962 RepID=UPI00316FBCC1
MAAPLETVSKWLHNYRSSLLDSLSTNPEERHAKRDFAAGLDVVAAIFTQVNIDRAVAKTIRGEWIQGLTATAWRRNFLDFVKSLQVSYRIIGQQLQHRTNLEMIIQSLRETTSPYKAQSRYHWINNVTSEVEGWEEAGQAARLTVLWQIARGLNERGYDGIDVPLCVEYALSQTHPRPPPVPSPRVLREVGDSELSRSDFAAFRLPPGHDYLVSNDDL